MNFWLLKTEPAEFGLDDLVQARGQTAAWTGVRNYEARNLIRDRIAPGDQAFFYHSSCARPGIVAVVEVTRAAYPDPTAWDQSSGYYDARSTRERPVWFAFDVRLVRALPRLVPLNELRRLEQLADMRLLRRGNRLSVSPVTQSEWQAIVGLTEGRQGVSDGRRIMEEKKEQGI